MIALLTAVLLSTTTPADRGPRPQEPAAPRPAAASLGFEALAGGARLRVHSVPGVPLASVWLRVGAGSDHDPDGQTGRARVLGAALRAAGPAPQHDRPVEVIVLAEATLVGVLLAPAELPEQAARIAGWLDGRITLDDDALLKARGRALLRADDEASVLPGPLLRERAERLLLGETPAARLAGGVAEEIRALDPGRIRAAFRSAFHPSRASIVVLGDLDPSEVRGLFEEQLVALDPRPADPLPTIALAADAAAPAATTVSDRVDAPFVAYGFPAPRWGDRDYLPFLIAMEVVRSHAAATFRTLRGGEIAAEFPPLSYDFTRMPRAAFVQRRGKDGDPESAVRAEVESLVAGARAGGAAPAQVGQAMAALLRTLELPPFSPGMGEALRRYPALLHQRGYVVLMYDLHGWPADLRAAIGDVTRGRVDAAIRSALADGHGLYVALRPAV